LSDEVDRAKSRRALAFGEVYVFSDHPANAAAGVDRDLSGYVNEGPRPHKRDIVRHRGERLRQFQAKLAEAVIRCAHERH
jgi:hypothetical protein